MNREELSILLNKEGIPSDWYSLSGDLEPGRIILYENYSKWEVFYYDERGKRSMLKTCLTEEEACMFIHQQLMQQMLSHQFIYYSQPPVIIPHTTESVLEVGFEATAIHIWLDSIIKNNHNLSNTNALIFLLEKDTDYYQKYTIHLYGSNKYSLTNNNTVTCFSVDIIPYHDWISIGSDQNEEVFEKVFSDILWKYIFHNGASEYRDLFKGKMLCVGFRNNIHALLS